MGSDDKAASASGAALCRCQSTCSLADAVDALSFSSSRFQYSESTLFWPLSFIFQNDRLSLDLISRDAFVFVPFLSFLFLLFSLSPSLVF